MRLSRAVVGACFACVVGAFPASADGSVAPAGKGVGVGVEVGAPTNLNVKLMLGPRQAIVVGVGGGIWYDLSLSLHVDGLWHVAVADFDDGNVSAYVGIGGWAALNDGKGGHFGYYQPFADGGTNVAFGARVPLGVSVAFNAVPLELYAEVVPAVSLFPGIGVFGQGGLGARFYF